MTEAESIVAAVRSVIGNKPGIGLHDPFITNEDRRNVAECMEEEPVGYVNTGVFEQRVAAYCGRKYAIAVASGTAALHLALISTFGPEREFRDNWKPTYRIPTMAFAALPAVLKYQNAQPHFCSSDPAGRQHIGVDLLGMPSGAIGAPLIDAAASLGTKAAYPSTSPPPLALSFNCNKIVTTGGGGMVLTDSEGFANEVRHLATTAKIPDPHHFRHDAIGFNYRMPNICAAMGLGQMRRLEETVERKRALHERYRNALPVPMWEEPTGCRANYWLNAITVKDRDATLRALTEAGIACRALFTPLHLQEPYRDCPRDEDLSAEEELWMHTVCLPSGAGVA